MNDNYTCLLGEQGLFITPISSDDIGSLKWEAGNVQLPLKYYLEQIGSSLSAVLNQSLNELKI